MAGRALAAPTAADRESREVREARRAYALALADRLADTLAGDDCDARMDEVRDIVRSLDALIPRQEVSP